MAVDRDNARAAFGQQADSRASDDPGSTGNDGNPAVEANSIGHRHFPFGHIPVISGFWPAQHARPA
ncbi:MAG TPA: hypothetical protein VF404_11400 [Sphingomonas sp.]